MIETPNISPISTYFRGFRFRSRLEARWHVFFDRLRIESQYEPEGWKLADGTLYLPDFFLPLVHLWAEAKPINPTPEERAKAEGIARPSTEMRYTPLGPNGLMGESSHGPATSRSICRKGRWVDADGMV